MLLPQMETITTRTIIYLFTDLSMKECRVKCLDWSECYAFRFDGTDCYIWTIQDKDECQISTTDSFYWVLIKSDKCN